MFYGLEDIRTLIYSIFTNSNARTLYLSDVYLCLVFVKLQVLCEYYIIQF